MTDFVLLKQFATNYIANTLVHAYGKKYEYEYGSLPKYFEWYVIEGRRIVTSPTREDIKIAVDSIHSQLAWELEERLSTENKGRSMLARGYSNNDICRIEKVEEGMLISIEIAVAVPERAQVTLFD